MKYGILYKMLFLDIEFFFAEPEDDEKKEENDQTFKQKNDALTAAFGSLKKRRAMQQRLKNALSAETLQSAVGDAVGATLVGDNVEKVLNEASQDRTSHELPPYDVDAVTPDDAYPLSSSMKA